jgi:hypothetical protein
MFVSNDGRCCHSDGRCDVLRSYVESTRSRVRKYVRCLCQRSHHVPVSAIVECQQQQRHVPIELGNVLHFTRAGSCNWRYVMSPVLREGDRAAPGKLKTVFQNCLNQLNGISVSVVN